MARPAAPLLAFLPITSNHHHTSTSRSHPHRNKPQQRPTIAPRNDASWHYTTATFLSQYARTPILLREGGHSWQRSCCWPAAVVNAGCQWSHLVLCQSRWATPAATSTSWRCKGFHSAALYGPFYRGYALPKRRAQLLLVISQSLSRSGCNSSPGSGSRSTSLLVRHGCPACGNALCLSSSERASYHCQA